MEQLRAKLTMLLALSAAATVFLTGCPGEPEVPDEVIPDGGYTPPPPPVQDAAPPPPPDASGPCDHTIALALQTAIQARAKKEVSFGMKPEGAFACQKVNEGGSASVAVTLQPGRCYTFLAHSYPDVTEIDVYLKPNLGPNPAPLLQAFAGAPFAQDSDTGPNAAIGRNKDCFKNPLPIPGAAIVEVTSRTGAGPVAVQVYSR